MNVDVYNKSMTIQIKIIVTTFCCNRKEQIVLLVWERPQNLGHNQKKFKCIL